MSLSVDIEKQLGDFHLRARFDADGGVTGLLGASGCGKSCTLKCVAGVERPDRGRIVLDGTVLFDSEARVDLPPQKRRVGYLFQHYALFPNMNVRKNILCGLHAEPNRGARETRMADVVRLLQLEGLENHRVGQISGGQAQRVALARILVGQPNLLMLDEPFSALDAHLREKLQLDMKSLLAEFGKSVLLVTHSRDEAYHLCDRIGVMRNGELLALKDTKALFADPETIGAASITGCKNIVRAEKRGEHEAYIPDWGLTLTTALPLRDGLLAVGIRAHYFNPRTPQNRFPVAFVGSMEEPFECIYRFRWRTQRPDTPDVWLRVSKDKFAFPAELGVAPVNVLPLYGE